VVDLFILSFDKKQTEILYKNKKQHIMRVDSGGGGGGAEGRGPPPWIFKHDTANVFSNKHLFCENIPTLIAIVILCWTG